MPKKHKATPGSQKCFTLLVANKVPKHQNKGQNPRYRPWYVYIKHRWEFFPMLKNDISGSVYIGQWQGQKHYASHKQIIPVHFRIIVPEQSQNGQQ